MANKGKKSEKIQQTHSQSSRYKSTMISIVKLFEEMKTCKNGLREEHLRVLQRTPFWDFFNSLITHQVKTRRYELPTDRIIEKYDSKRKKFKIGNQYITINEDDISLIFGISSGDEPLKLKYNKKIDTSGFIIRRFKNITRLDPKAILDALSTALEGQEPNDIEDVARLLSLYLCLTLFFATTGNTLKWGFVKYVEDIDEMRRYNWSEAIVNALMSTFEQISVSGCVLALQYWICEYTHIIQPSSPNQFPRFLKWDLGELNKAFKYPGFSLSLLDDAKVIVGELEHTEDKETVYGDLTSMYLRTAAEDNEEQVEKEKQPNKDAEEKCEEDGECDDDANEYEEENETEMESSFLSEEDSMIRGNMDTTDHDSDYRNEDRLSGGADHSLLDLYMPSTKEDFESQDVVVKAADHAVNLASDSQSVDKFDHFEDMFKATQSLLQLSTLDTTTRKKEMKWHNSKTILDAHELADKLQVTELKRKQEMHKASKLKNEVEFLRAQLKSAANEINKLKGRHNEIDRNEDIELKVFMLTRQNENLKKKYDDMQRLLAKQTRENQTIKLRVTSIEAEIKLMSGRMLDKEILNEELVERLWKNIEEYTRHDVTQKEDSQPHLEEQLCDQTTQISVASDELKNLNEQNNRIKNRGHEVHQDFDTMREKKDKEIEDLKKQLARKRKEAIHWQIQHSIEKKKRVIAQEREKTSSSEYSNEKLPFEQQQQTPQKRKAVENKKEEEKERSMIKNIKGKSRKNNSKLEFVYANKKRLKREVHKEKHHDEKEKPQTEKKIFVVKEQIRNEYKLPTNYLIYKKLTKEEQHILATVNELFGRHGVVFRTTDFKDFISLEDICLVIMEQRLGSNVVDAYANILMNQQQMGKKGSGTSFVLPCSSLKYVRYKKSDPEFLEKYLNPIIGQRELEHRYYIFPLLSRGEGSGKNHWSLAVLDVKDEKWRLYNPLSGQQTRLTNEDQLVDIYDMIKYVESYRKAKNLEVFAKVDIVETTPQQAPGSYDCGVIVCHVMSKIFRKEEVIPSCNVQDIRAEMVKIFLSSKKQMRNEEEYHLVQGYQSQESKGDRRKMDDLSGSNCSLNLKAK